MRKLNGHLHGQCTTSQLDSNLERCRKMFFSVSDTGSSEEKIKVIPTGVEP